MRDTSGPGRPTGARPPLGRTAVVVVLTLLAALAVTPPAGAAPAPLRVLTLNMHHGSAPDGRTDLDRLAAELRAARADVIALQEVDRHFGGRSGFRDQAAELAARLGMTAVFGAHLDLGPADPGDPPRQYGTAVLSRHPVVSTATLRLPAGAAGEEPRGLLEVVLAAPDGPVRVLTTHLTPGRPDSRMLQARAVAARIARSPQPVLLLGDLNAEPGSPEVRLLTALLTDAGGGPTFPADAPTQRIDYVLGEGRFSGAEVLPTRSSDHRAVLAVFAPGREGARRAQSGACSGCGPIAMA